MRERLKTPPRRAMCRISGTCAGLCAGLISKKPNEINDVPDVPDLEATFPCVRVRVRARAKQNFLPLAWIYPLHIRHIRHIVVFIKKKEKKGGTVSGTFPKSPAHPGTNPDQNRKTIRCTPENAAQMQQVVKAWPELHALVQGLQAQDMFPGLRALQITLTGSAEHVGKGLAALLPENAPEGRK